MQSNVYKFGYNAGQTLHNLLQTHTTHLPSPPSVSTVLNRIVSFPSFYKEWWFNLLTNDPIHVLVETILLLSVSYMILSRRNRDWRADIKETLSEQEKEELIKEWRECGRAPLVPHEQDENRFAKRGKGKTPPAKDGRKTPSRVAGSDGVVVVKVDGSRMVIRDRMTDGEETAASSSTTRTVLNFATHDFLGMSVADSSHSIPVAESHDDEDDEGKQNGGIVVDEANTEHDNKVMRQQQQQQPNPIKEASREALSIYGCGSCGPRGFYGTIDTHLELEEKISNFVGTDGAIMYSDGASASSSAVAAFAKRGDLLVVDEGIYEALSTGVTLSRATVKWFRHNDMNDLRRVLERIRSTDKALKRKSADQRRFIVVEGLYKNSGTIAPLSDLVALKHEFNYRLILDESFSFGTLGQTGRGVLELYEKKHMRDAEIVTISLEYALGSIGGVCVGNEEVVDHQRLSGAGYCFSASAPPFVACAAVAALKRMQDEPDLIKKLGKNRAYLYEKLKGHMSDVVPKLLVVTSDELSPIVFLQLAGDPNSGLMGELERSRLPYWMKFVESVLKTGWLSSQLGGTSWGTCTRYLHRPYE